MNLQNITTPQEEPTPQMRYASLHRAVERGLASDEVLRELVEICLELGHLDEARRVHDSMKPGAVRNMVGSMLARRGLIDTPRNKPGRGRPHANSQAKRVQSRLSGLQSSLQSSLARPAAAAQLREEPSVRDHVIDALQFLFQAHMPIVALVTMLAFPVVVGLGGFLTAGGSLWLFAGLAAIPGLCVLGIVGAMGRSIFLYSFEANGEVPAVPTLPRMVGLAKRHLGDALLVLGALVAPSLTLIWFDAPLVSSLPGLVLGMFLTPIALILRMVRGDIGALSPVALIRGIGCSRGYSRVVGAFWLAFAPAAIAFWCTLGYAIWLQIAIVGPLAVLPTFATMRLLGTFTEVHRDRLKVLLHVGPSTQRTRQAAERQKRAAAGPQSPNLPPRPSTISKKKQHTTPQPSPLHERPRAAAKLHQRRDLPPAARRIEGRAPAARPPVLGKQPAPPPNQKLRLPLEPDPVDFEGPDVSGIPGARVISAEDRERLGAASRRQ